jgi:hypothetical protein
MIECECNNPKSGFSLFQSSMVGIDEERGRYGEVSILKCARCGSLWLHYLVEYEGFTGSGRWYRAPLTEGMASRVTPRNAVEILRGIPWHFYGGSYFRTDGSRGTGIISVD